MEKIKYVALDRIAASDFIPVLNSQRVRTHLIDHEQFDVEKTRSWVQSKIEMDAIAGCKVRAIMVEDQLAGWCGIQLEGGKYEIAIVIDDGFWGIGKTVFGDMMQWAKVLGHDHVYLHLLDTRPEYQFLRKISENVFESELMGSRFLTYQLAVR